MNNKILVIEDDKEINNLICDILNQNNYETMYALNGLDGLRLIKNSEFDLVILDVMLPYKNGDILLTELRKISLAPVIIISAKGLIKTKVELLRLGADDYITKPFNLEEILARVESNIRRYKLQYNMGKDSSMMLTYKDIKIDIENNQVIVGENQLDFTSKEYEILKLLLGNPKKTFSKVNIFESIWKEEYCCDDDTLNTHISNIRSKLKKVNKKENYIETIWGLGYRLYKV